MAEFYAGAVTAKIIFDDSQFNQAAKGVQDQASAIGKAGDAAGALLKKGMDLAVQGLEASVYAAEDFNKVFKNVTTLVDPATVDIGKMRSELLALDNRLGSATELTDGLYQAISASVEPAKAVQFVGKAAKFAKAGLTSTNKAVDVITTSLNAYGLEADQAGRVSDVLFETIKRGKTTGDQLARAIGKSIPLAASAGVEFEELGATLAVLTRQGNSTSESTTQVNSVISSLIKPSKGLGTVIDTLGIKSIKTEIAQKGLVGTIKEMIAQTDGSNEAIANLFPNIRALRGVLALTGPGAQDFNEVLEGMNNAAGATSEAFEKQELTFETFQNAVNKLAISLGDELLPFVYTVTEYFTSFIEQLTKSGNLANTLSEGVGFVAGAFNLLTTALKPVVEDLLKAGTEEFEEIAEKITDSSDATKQAQAPFAIFAKALGIVSDVGNVLIKSVSLAAKSIINLVNTANSAGKVLQEIGKLLTFQESDVAGAWAELGNDFGVLTDDLVHGVEGIVTSSVDAINGLFEDVSADAEKFQKLFNDGMDDAQQKMNEHKQAADNAKASNDALADSFDSSGEAAQKASVAYYNTYEALKKKYTATKDLSAATLEDIEAENKRIENLKLEKQAWEDLGSSILDVATDSLGSLTDGLLNVGIALGTGGDAAASFGEAMGDVAKEILKALPALLLQAGLQMLAVNLPVGLGLIAAAGVAALGVGAVMGALGIDEKADGGPAHGLTLVGEEGPELVNFGSPSMVTPANETEQMMGGNMYFYFTGPINSDIDLRRAGAELGRQLQAKRTVIR